MEIATKSGAILTDATLNKLADEWENDTWAGQLTNITMGRPRISSENLVTVTFKIPQSQFVAIEQKAREKDETKWLFGSLCGLNFGKTAGNAL